MSKCEHESESWWLCVDNTNMKANASVDASREIVGMCWLSIWDRNNNKTNTLNLVQSRPQLASNQQYTGVRYFPECCTPKHTYAISMFLFLLTCVCFGDNRAWQRVQTKVQIMIFLVAGGWLTDCSSWVLKGSSTAVEGFVRKCLGTKKRKLF